MHSQNQHTEISTHNQVDITKLTVILIIGIIISLLSLYEGYRYSQTKRGDIILPGGVTYLGPSR